MSNDSNQSSRKATTGHSQQAAQSLSDLLDQCETQRSQLDTFLAGFEKKVVGKTIIGQSVTTESIEKQNTQSATTKEPAVSDNVQIPQDTQVSPSIPRDMEAQLSPVNIQSPQVENWLKGSVTRLQTLDTSLSRREQRLSTLEGRLKDVVQSLTEKIQQAQSNKQSLEKSLL